MVRKPRKQSAPEFSGRFHVRKIRASLGMLLDVKKYIHQFIKKLFSQSSFAILILLRRSLDFRFRLGENERIHLFGSCLRELRTRFNALCQSESWAGDASAREARSSASCAQASSASISGGALSRLKIKRRASSARSVGSSSKTSFKMSASRLIDLIIESHSFEFVSSTFGLIG